MGWGKYQKSHAATVGDIIMYKGENWVIHSATYPNQKYLAKRLIELSEYEKTKPFGGEYIYTIQTIIRQTDYKREKRYRILRKQQNDL